MTAHQEATPRYAAVLFDCDGVLVDSEPITCGVLRDMLQERGWPMTIEECMRRFIGKAVKDEGAAIEHHTGQPLTEDWMMAFRARRDAALSQRLLAIPNAVDAVRRVHALYGGRIACASGADRAKVELQLRKVGLSDCFAGRIFSGHELPRSKPHPDVYLVAAEALGVDPRACVVVEDTVAGVTAGVAAGATVLGYCPGPVGHSSPDELRRAGVWRLFADMAELVELVT
jgi:HAD superfamily hydrolase (TIGR01509 family)